MLSTQLRNVLDLSTLDHLTQVAFTEQLVPGEHYWAVYAPNGVPRTNWKHKFKFVQFAKEEIESPVKTVIIGECDIMDGNYVFEQLYLLSEYILYIYEE